MPEKKNYCLLYKPKFWKFDFVWVQKLESMNELSGKQIVNPSCQSVVSLQTSKPSISLKSLYWNNFFFKNSKKCSLIISRAKLSLFECESVGVKRIFGSNLLAINSTALKESSTQASASSSGNCHIVETGKDNWQPLFSIRYLPDKFLFIVRPYVNPCSQAFLYTSQLVVRSTLLEQIAPVTLRFPGCSCKFQPFP